MKNATEWMALDDDAWEYDAYGAWVYVSPGDDIELLVDDLNEAVAGRHQLSLEEISETEPYRLHIDGAVHLLPLAAKDRDAYDVLTLVIGALQADTSFYMDRDDVGDDMHSILCLPRAEAEAMQAAHPRAVETRLLPLPPGLDVWLLVEEWCVGAPPDPADAAHQAALQEARVELKQAIDGFLGGATRDKWRVLRRVFAAFRNDQLTSGAHWKTDPQAVRKLAGLWRVESSASAEAFTNSPVSLRHENSAKPASSVVQKDPWWKLW